MRITKYLDANNILWFPINLRINNEGKKKLDPIPHGTFPIYTARLTDFKDLTKEKIQYRQVLVDKFDYIAIDTNDINHIDVDTLDHTEYVNNLKATAPYFLSATKQLPHVFCTFDTAITSARVQTIHKGIEILTGSWSFCRKDAIVMNCDTPVPCFKNEDFIAPKTKREIDENSRTYDMAFANIDIDLLLSHIATEHADDFTDWFKIGCAIHNSGFSYANFETFSKRSPKYTHDCCESKWNELVDNPMNEITFGTLVYYLSLNDDNDAKLYRNKLLTILKTTDQTDELITLYAKGSLTNAGAAKIFYEGFKDKYIFSHNHWFQLTDGGIIKKLSFDSDIILAKALLVYVHKFIYDILQNTTDDDKKKKLWGSIVKLESSQFQMGCITQLKLCYNDEYLFDKLDLNQNLIGFTNGIYDLKNDLFRVGTIEDMVSMDVGYDYKPIIDDNKTLFFDNLINGYFRTPETARWFKKHLGSLIQGGNTDEKAFFWTGNGRNGKGTIDTILMNALGPYYHELPVEFFTLADKSSSAPKPEILAMRNRRCCMTHEPEGNVKWLTGKFKKSTGNDPLSARDMYSGIVEKFKPSHKNIIQSNSKPVFTDVDNALLARLVVIDFPFTYCDTNDFDPAIETHRKMDTHLKQSLHGTGSDFINYLIHYNALYRKEGIEDYSDEIKESIETYRKETDTIRSFLNIALNKSTSPDAKIFTTQLLEYHNTWSGIDMNPKEFVKRLKANDITPSKIRVNRIQGAGISGYVFKPGFVDTINGNQCDSDDDGD
jgi:hypothetical protein